MAGSVSFGGIYLPLATSAAWARAEIGLSLSDALEFAAADNPARYRISWPAAPAVLQDRSIRLGELEWKPDARNFATFHCLCEETRLATIREAAYADAAYQALPLVIDDGTTSITTDLFLLPPRPLTQCDGGANLWLLSFVDARFFWWQRAANITVIEGTTTWVQLFTAIGTGLGVTITTDTISSAYLKPPASLTSRYSHLPLLLDAACAAVGHRLVVALDGTVTTQTALTAADSQDDQYATWARPAGGQYAFAAATTSAAALLGDLTPLVPATVDVVFPQLGTDVPVVYARTLAGLALTEFVGVAGRPSDTKILRSTAIATAGATPGNDTELGTLATQIVTDHLRWSLGRNHVSYAGVADYEPEGFHEIQWTTREGQFQTLVRRCPRDDWFAAELQQSSTTGGSTTPEKAAGTGYALPTEISPTALTVSTDQNNLTLPATAWLTATTTAASSITGVVAPSTNYFQFITNLPTATANLTLPNQSGSSSAANRFKTADGADLILKPGQSAVLLYDTTISRWRTARVSGEPIIKTLNLPADTNNYSLLSLTRDCCPKTLLVSTTASGKKLTGLADLLPGVPVTITNVGTLSMIVPNASGSSTTPFTTATAADVTLAAGQSMTFVPTVTGNIVQVGASNPSVSVSSGTPYQKVLSVAYTDLAVAATSTVLLLYTAPARSAVLAVVLIADTAFTDGAACTVTADVGVKTPSPTEYITGIANNLSSPATNNFNSFPGSNIRSWNAGDSTISIKVTASVNLNTLTAGAAKVYALLMDISG